MASASRTIRTIFTGDSTALAAASLVARRHLDGFDSAMKKIEATQAAVRKALALTAAGFTAAGLAAPALLVGASTAFIGLAALGVSTSERVVKAFANVGSSIADKFTSDTARLVPVALDIANRVGQAFAQIRPILQRVFANAGFQQQILDLTDGILGLAKNALPGLAQAALAAGPAMRGLRDFLKDTGTAVSEFFINISAAGPQAGQVFDQLAKLIGQVLPVLGQLLAVATKFATGALPGLISSVITLLHPLSALLSFIEPIAPFLGQATAAVVLASVALKVLGGIMLTTLAAGAGFALLTGNIGAFAIRAVAAVAAFTPFGPVIARALGSADRFTGVIGRIGSLLTGATIAVVAAGLAWDALTLSASEGADALREGGQAAADAMTRFQQQGEAVKALAETTGEMGEEARGAAVLLDLLTTSSEEFKATLSGLQLAQAEAAEALNRYNQAVQQFGPASEQAKAAHEQLGLAIDKVKSFEEQATAATKGHTQALVELSQTMAAQGNAALQYQQALLRIAEAEKAATDAVKQHKAGSQEAQTATLQLQQAYLSAAEAAGKKAEADNASLGPQEASRRGAAAFRDELVRLAGTTSGAARSALIGLINNFDQSGISAVAADLKAKGFQVTLARQPSGKETIVSVQTAQAERDLTNLARTRTATVYVKAVFDSAAARGAFGGGSVRGLARGGPIYGPGSGTSDTAGLFALSRGEHVWTAAEVRAAGGHGGVAAIRSAVLRGFRGLASGGPVGTATVSGMPGVTIKFFVDGQEFRGMVRTEIEQSSRDVARRVGAGVGTTY